MTVLLCPLGDALTRGSRRDASGALMVPTHASYRYTLYTLMAERGYAIDYVGSTTYPDFDPAAFPFDQDNEAHGGDTTLSVIAGGVAEWMAGYTPDIVILLAGREDAFDGTLIADRLNALSTILQRLREKNPKVWVLLGTCPPTLDGAAGEYRTANQITPYNNSLPAWVAGVTTAQSSVILVDCHTGFVQAHVAADGLELSAAGDAWLAGRFIMALDAALPAWATATGLHYTPDPIPPPGGDEEPPDPNPAPGVIPRLKATPTAGLAPLGVTFVDTSIVDQWTRTYEAWLIDVPLADIQEGMKYLPSYFKISRFVINPTEGTNPDQWHRENWYDGVCPWPNKTNTIIFWNGTSNDHGFVANYGGLGAGDGRVSIPLWQWEFDQHQYANIGQVTHHELLHTINGLETSDGLYRSAGFKVWLQGYDPNHPMITAPLGVEYEADPAHIPPRTYELLELFYRYLDETYRTTPGMTNGAVTFNLDFGDASPHSTEPDVLHTYAAGTYTIEYAVSANGQTGTIQYPGLIQAAGPAEHPTATFEANRLSGTAPLDVQFTYTGSGATGFSWNFGDGSNRVIGTPTPAHVYSEPGAYSPSLIVSGPGGSAEYMAPNYIIVASPSAPAPTAYMLLPAGITSLLGFMREAWAYIQVLNAEGVAVGDRIYQEEAWSQDEAGQVWIDGTIEAAPLTAHLPLTIGGIEVWTAATGGDRITRIMFTDAPELIEFRIPEDTLDMHIGVGLTGMGTTPRITDALIAGSTRIGDRAVIQITLYGGAGAYRIDTPTITRDVLSGGEAQVRLTFTRIE